MGQAKTAPPCRHAIFEFSDLTLDTGQRIVFRDTVSIRLSKLTYELLLALVEAAPNVLTHQDLVARVWQGRVVSPETVAQRMLLLRRALGDEASNPRYLRSVRGLGYQLVPMVSTRSRHGERRISRPTMILERSPDMAGFAEDIDLSPPTQPSIVVLPFDTVEDYAEHRNFARGLTHDIMTRIARTRSFFVIARGSAFRFAPGSHDAREIGRMLGVRYFQSGRQHRW
jgi:DNA-binding winged helix-turn-helix (wHTH) protein